MTLEERNNRLMKIHRKILLAKHEQRDLDVVRYEAQMKEIMEAHSDGLAS